MLDSNLAKLYEAETKALNQAVKRNITRFPDNFMFQLSKEELQNLTFLKISKILGNFRRRKIFIYM